MKLKRMAREIVRVSSSMNDSNSRNNCSIRSSTIVVVREHLPSELGIILDERIDTLLHHHSRHITHHRDIDVGFELRLFVQLDRPFADILRQVADSLEFGGDFHRRRHQPQVSRGRLMEGQQSDTLFVDLHIQRIDLVVPLDDLAGQDRIARHQCGEGLCRSGLPPAQPFAGAWSSSRRVLRQSGAVSSGSPKSSGDVVFGLLLGQAW